MCLTRAIIHGRCHNSSSVLSQFPPSPHNLYFSLRSTYLLVPQLTSLSLLAPQLNIFTCPSAQNLYLPLSSQSLPAPQFNIFTSPSAGQLLTCPSVNHFLALNSSTPLNNIDVFLLAQISNSCHLRQSNYGKSGKWESEECPTVTRL